MTATDPVVMIKVLDAAPDRVWRAITDKDEMKEWYFNLPEFKAEPGFEFEFLGGDGTTEFLHKCEVLVAKPNEKLVHTWTYPGYDGSSEVSWELEKEGPDKTRLTLKHTGLHTFPESTKAFARENFEAGWGDIVGQLLPDYLSEN